MLHLLEQDEELNSDEKLTGMTDLFWGKKQQIENSLEENFSAQWFLFLSVSGEWTVLIYVSTIAFINFFQMFLQN